jgi:hypothetical protein
MEIHIGELYINTAYILLVIVTPEVIHHITCVFQSPYRKRHLAAASGVFWGVLFWLVGDQTAQAALNLCVDFAVATLVYSYLWKPIREYLEAGRYAELVSAIRNAIAGNITKNDKNGTT